MELQIPDPDWEFAPHAPAPHTPQPRLAAAGRVSVCTGRKCCAQGALQTLEAARRVAEGSGVEVVATKCMGKCGVGPCVRARVEGREGAPLARKVEPGCAAALLRQQYGTTDASSC